MKKLASVLILALALCSSSVARNVRFMPQWYPQAQFAGFYVAQEKGFYADEGLDVDIVHAADPTPQSVMQMLLDGKVDIINMQLIPAMIEKAGGADLTNILQISHNSALVCVSHEPFDDFSDLNGKRVGQCSEGLAEPADIMCHEMDSKIEWHYSEQAINLFLAKAVDAVLIYSYNEYLSLLFAMGEISPKNILRFSDADYNFPEDGLYATSQYLKANGESADCFVRATMKGWRYAAAHQEEAVDIVMKYVREYQVITNRPMQKMMLKEILRLQTNPKTGKPDFSYVSKEMFDVLIQDMLTLGYIDKSFNYESFVR